MWHANERLYAGMARLGVLLWCGAIGCSAQRSDADSAGNELGVARQSVSAAAAAPAPISPPFTQCPAVGADPSCKILIVIEKDGSLRVKSDPTLGPYDGVEDTLIGVQNNSDKTISKIPLKSSLPIFGFDGDGLCAYLGCNNDPTGYGGPGVSFANISPDFGSGTVLFANGIAPGGSAYFSLEEAIETQCPTQIPVEHLSQSDSRWGDTFIANSATYSIADKGCYITSAAMIINYHAKVHGIKTPGNPSVDFRTDPGTLDQWLTDNNGYSGLSAIPSKIAKYAQDSGVLINYDGPTSKRDDFLLDDYICNSNPVMLRVKGDTHSVVVTGQAVSAAGKDTYSVDDPGFGQPDLDNAKYGNTYQNMRLFSYAGAKPTDDSALYVYVHSPVQAHLIAADGHAAGYDLATSSVLFDIPRSGYNSELNSLADVVPPDQDAVKVLELLRPATGAYTLELIGTGAGAFAVDVVDMTTTGVSTTQSIVGTAELGLVRVYQVAYSATSSTTLQVTETGQYRLPSADAGPDQTTAVGQTVNLSGTSNGGGSSASYTWTQLDGVAVALNNANAAVANFVPLQAGQYTFGLVVSDGSHSSLQDVVAVVVSDNRPPTADAGPDRVIECTSSGGAIVPLDGSKSQDPDGDTLSFVWTGPFGQASGAKVSALFPIGSGTATITANDGRGGVASDSAIITVRDTTPPKPSADLVATCRPEKNEGHFRVAASCTDVCSTGSVHASINGIPVSNGQIVQLEVEKKTKSHLEHGTLSIEAPSFTLNVSCADAAGNTSAAKASPAFAKK